MRVSQVDCVSHLGGRRAQRQRKRIGLAPPQAWGGGGRRERERENIIDSERGEKSITTNLKQFSR